MPVPYLKSLSKETGKSISELEKLWGKAKKIASEHFNKPESEFDDKEFAYVVGIVKNMLGKEENVEVLTVTEDVKIPGTEIMIKKGQTFEFSVVEEDSVALNEKTDWGKIEQALLKHGLKFNKYGILFNDRNFELTRMYLSSDYTVLTFYNQKGFKSMFNGMEFPLLIVAEYEDAIEDINKERPDDIRIFDDVDDGYSYASHLDSRAEEYSRYKNSRDFLLTQKELCEEVEMRQTEIKEEKANEESITSLNKNDKFKNKNGIVCTIIDTNKDKDGVEYVTYKIDKQDPKNDKMNGVISMLNQNHYALVHENCIDIIEECRIPGTDIILEAGDKIHFKELYDKPRYILKASPYKPDVWKVSWIDDYWDKSGYFFMDDAGSFENSKFYEPGSFEIWKSLPDPIELIRGEGKNFALCPDSYPFGKKFVLQAYDYKVSW